MNLAYELLNMQQSIDGLMSILSLFIIHVALVHVRIESFWINYSHKRNLWGIFDTEHSSDSRERKRRVISLLLTFRLRIPEGVCGLALIFSKIPA